MKLYGLSNCDSCRKARAVLTRQGVDHVFVDLATQPPDEATIERWLASVGEDALVNRRSRSWRELDDKDRQRAAVGLLAEHPKLMKRPILVRDAAVMCGGGERDWLAFATGG